MQTARLKARHAGRLRHLLLWVSLLLLAPLAHAHELHNTGYSRSAVLRVAPLEIAVVKQPCGSGGGEPCCCGNACCVSPNQAKLPVIPQARAFLASAGFSFSQAYPLIQAPRAVSPIKAFAAPRAPPLSL
jgi:hypothetical protein